MFAREGSSILASSFCYVPFHCCAFVILPQSLENKGAKVVRCQQTDLPTGAQAL